MGPLPILNLVVVVVLVQQEQMEQAVAQVAMAAHLLLQAHQ